MIFLSDERRGYLESIGVENELERDLYLMPVLKNKSAFVLGWPELKINTLDALLEPFDTRYGKELYCPDRHDLGVVIQPDMFVFDIDCHSSTDEPTKPIMKCLTAFFGETYVTASENGGYHVYYRGAPEVVAELSQQRIRERFGGQVELKRKGQYVKAACSTNYYIENNGQIEFVSKEALQSFLKPKYTPRPYVAHTPRYIAKVVMNEVRRLRREVVLVDDPKAKGNTHEPLLYFGLRLGAIGAAEDIILREAENVVGDLSIANRLQTVKDGIRYGRQRAAAAKAAKLS